MRLHQISHMLKGASTKINFTERRHYQEDNSTKDTSIKKAPKSSSTKKVFPLKKDTSTKTQPPPKDTFA